MKRTPEHIDNAFRERLQHAAPPPPAFVWDNVERELRKRKKKRFIFWLFPTALAGAIITGALWLSNQGTQESMSSLSPALEMNQAVETESAPIVNNIAEEPASNTAIAATEAESTRATSVTNKENSIKGNVTLPKIKVAPLTASPKNKTPNDLPQQSAQTTTPAPETEPLKTAFEGKKTNDNWSAAQQLPLLKPAAITRDRAVPMPVMVPKSEAPRASLAKAKSKKAVKNCYDFSRQPSAWMLEGYLGPSLAQRELISKPDDIPYLNKRLNSEKRDLAFNAGVRASLMLKGNFLLRTGLHYDQITEVFEYIDPKFVITHVAHVYHPDTGLTTLDTVGVEYGENYLKTYNRLGMLDIPLMVGIELRKGRSGFNLNAGMSFNLLFWKRGYIISPQTGGPVSFSGNQGLEVFRPYTGLSATASVQWFYHVKPRLRVFVEPSFRKIMRPVSAAQHPVEQRYGIGGLRFGLTQILNR